MCMNGVHVCVCVRACACMYKCMYACHLAWCGVV